MSRLEVVGSWFCTCLGMVLLGLSILVIPGNAFADAGGDCYNSCLGDPGCTAVCCATACPNQPTCHADCCEGACGGNDTCLDMCLAAGPISCQAKVCKDKDLGTCTKVCEGKECKDGLVVGRCFSVASGDCKCIDKQ